MTAESNVKVAPETFIRAETDRMFYGTARQAGGVNKLYHFRTPTPLDKQTVIRMNLDTLYSMGVVDTVGGATITVPEMPKDRYFSVYLVDNDHYVPEVIYESGTHKLPADTKYLGIGVRIQLLKADDPGELALINKLQDQFVIKAQSADPFPEPKWDKASLDALRAEYEKEFQSYAQYEADWQGPRGKVNEKTRHLAAAGAWGLFPEWDAVYINYSGGHDHTKCFCATYKVPENNAFWSITVYGKDGYMKHDNSIINNRNVKSNDDGTFTVHFGPKQACRDAPNRLDVSEGWNFLMRVYRPGSSVLDGSYKLPIAVETIPPTADANHLVTPADFGATDTAYKVSETDFNMKRNLAKAPVNHWAHQDDVSNVKTQQVIRENQDVIYSSAVVDISQGATISCPASDVYQVIQIIDFQNYIVDVLYPGESLTVTPDKVSYGNYVYLNMRIRKLPPEKGGLEATHKLQRQATISANAARPYSSPDIVLDSALMERIRMALIRDVETGKFTDTTSTMGTPQDTDPQGHLYATAYGWGGMAVSDAAYQPIVKNLTKVEGGKALPSSITFKPPEIDYSRGGFWSITTYNSEGWLAEDQAAISNDQAEPNADGTYTIRFNSPGQKNNVKTPAPFSALLRVYVPKSRQGIIEYLAKMSDALVIR